MKLVILGAGGHGRMVAALARAAGQKIDGFIDPGFAPGTDVAGIPVLGGDEVLQRMRSEDLRLVNGIGSVESTDSRAQAFSRAKSQGFRFATMIHPTAFVDPTAVLGEGTVVAAGAIVQCGSIIGENVIINTGACLDHDCAIENHVHVAPGAVLSGGVRVGEKTHLGLACAVVQGVRIGQNVLVGAGAVVRKNVADSQYVAPPHCSVRPRRSSL